MASRRRLRGGVVKAGIADRPITGNPAIRRLKNALESLPALKGKLILHSDQGIQYTAKTFIDYCESVHVTLSMSKGAVGAYEKTLQRAKQFVGKAECIERAEA